MNAASIGTAHFIFLSESCTFLFTFLRKYDIIELSINKRTDI